MSDLVSVIVPVYNVEKYIERCLDSIINQTYTNLEIILVDDGSKDSSGKICDEYAAKDQRVKVIHKENGGVGSARNLGLDISLGQYIVFVDSDDWINSNLVLDNVSMLKKENADAIFFNHYEVMGANTVEYSGFQTFYSKEIILEKFVKRSLCIAMWNCIFHKDIWKEIRFSNATIGEDGEIIFDLFFKCNKIIINQNKYYYYFRNNETSLTSIVKPIYYYYELLSYINLEKYNERISADLYRYIVNFGCKLAIKVYCYNYFLKFLLRDQEIFLEKYIDLMFGNKPTNIYNKLFLFDYRYIKLFTILKSILKSMEYYYKYH